MNSRFITFFTRFSRIVPHRVVARFTGLRMSLAKASMRVDLRVYVGLVVFASIVSGFAAFVFSLPLLTFFNPSIVIVPLLPLVLAVLIGVLAGGFALAVGYAYPKIVASSRGGKIEANLPIISNFMAVLASSGMPPEGIFHSLARVGKEFKVDKEAQGIIRDIALMGLDLHTAVKKAADRSPSKSFATLLDGFVTTSAMGGDLAAYLRLEADKFKRARMLKMRRFLDNLGVIAETYIAFMVAAPLMLIVMLSVMAFIGGGVTIANLDPTVIMNLLTFVFMPAGVVIMIFIVDMMTPLR